MSEAGDNLSKMPEGVNAAMSEKEQIKDVFRELLGEMPAFPEWCKDSGEARLQLKQRSWAPRVPDAPGSQAKEQQAKVSGIKHSRIVRRAQAKGKCREMEPMGVP